MGFEILKEFDCAGQNGFALTRPQSGMKKNCHSSVMSFDQVAGQWRGLGIFLSFMGTHKVDRVDIGAKKLP